MNQAYRPEIDGIRAIAVLPILLFHLDAALCPGGFIGVDIFFVISGYLITRMIVSQGESFQFATFYVRRLFRLFPALLVTLAATLIAGWWVLGPYEYTRLAQSALTAIFGVSNFHFLEAVDYFEPSNLSHPLLHTWSLGVEEQFYLLWPALLVATGRWVRSFWMTVLGVAFLSFCAAVFVQSAYPQAAFYMMPFRMFEFAMGASLVGMERRWASVPKAANALTGLLACAMLAIAFVAFDEQTPWPGAWTLVPALGTALLILASGKGLLWRVLSHGVPRFFGRISYSLYLVHWPLIALWRHGTIVEPGYDELVVLGALSVALGIALYVLVEKPFRLREGLKTVYPVKRIAAILAASCAVFLGGVGAVVATNGFPSRLDRERVQFLDAGLTYAGDLCDVGSARCEFGERGSKRIVYVLGDSHALNLVFGLDRLFRENGIKGVALYDHGCLFAYGTKSFTNGNVDQRCQNNVAAAYDFLAKTHEPIILASNYAGYRNKVGETDAPLRQEEPEYYDWLGRHLTSSLAKIGANERTVIVFKQTYTTGINLAKCLAIPGEMSCTPMSREGVQTKYKDADQMLDRVVAAFDAAVAIDPKALFCDTATCETQNDDGLYFRDASHLTNAGSEFLITRAKDVLLSELARPH